LPKVKSIPVATPAAPSRRTSQSVTNSGALTAAKSESKRKTNMESTPAPANSRAR
jgi:hypothetical protein